MELTTIWLPEKDCTAQSLMEQIQGLLSDPDRYSEMSKALLKLSVPDSAEKLCDIIEQSIVKRS